MPISLPVALQETYTLAGSTVENNNAAAPVGIHVLMTGTQSVTFQYQKGTPATTAFVPGAHTDTQFITVDLGNGKWTSSSGTGTLTGAQLTAAKNAVSTLRNQAETLAVSIVNLFPSATIPVTW